MVKEDLMYFITGNHHKFNEINMLFQEEKLNLELKQMNLDTIEIQADSLKEIALFKLKSLEFKKKYSFFVEDAGFFVDEPLGGFPGVYSSYVLKTIGNEGVLKLIDDFENSKAHFSCVIALYFQPEGKICTFEGRVDGKVSNVIKGSGGFGYDPIFLPNEIPANTFAELTTVEKNSISHRGKALRKLMDFLIDAL